ncbi:LytR/AlgR family response regulator transcription factor [Paramaledivibacter caminithermalis]|uniref:Stage 0 sporulation protein A homolog n=1 Tax=Paramaledivibacter caminithermalis (strain DSM 15212 / CIP 107654 / DViRD3) TaxID=1121301 RepID=A0A1M6TPV5_PARC5|nr:LytTR family DNA-binding domain-containing protein [Paramaledivibacter caminithermalis]SHK58974.1 two component transcriptional regulator, LytTR family [Paramaledivibacter caminithermalis DSM 15212]
MKLTIAVCDDESTIVEIVTSHIKSQDNNYEVKIIEALSGEELLEKIENKKIDVAFLDIEMEGIDGIELGKEIRKKYKDCIIVFITGFKARALEAFDINAFQYILKPITQERFSKCINDINLRLEEKIAFKEKNSIFIINNKKSVVKVKYKDIFYFEKLLNKIKVYTSEGDYEYYGTLKELKKELDMEKSFIQCHQGYIVNMSKIYKLKDKQIYMRDIKGYVPVSRKYKTEIKKILEENLFK